MKSKYFQCLILIICPNSLWSQILKPNNYIIITSEINYSKSFEGIKKSYWLIPLDSLKSRNIICYQLYLSEISKTNFEACCSGKDIDPYIVLASDTSKNYFDRKHFELLDKLEKMIFTKRKKIETIIKRWISSNSLETITLFATSVSGVFCSSNYGYLSLQDGYKGKLFIPYSSFKMDEDFWKSDKANYILNGDFSKTDFEVVR